MATTVILPLIAGNDKCVLNEQTRGLQNSQGIQECLPFHSPWILK